MKKAGDDYKIDAVIKSVKEAGDYDNRVEIRAYDFSPVERGCTYKIDSGLSASASKKIVAAIEQQALKLNFKVAQIF